MIEKESSTRAPTSGEVHRLANRAERLDLRILMPAVVTKYDAASGKVDVKPLVKDAFIDESDERQVESFPVIPGCVVQFLGAGGFRLTCPISDGTLVINGNKIKATTGSLMFTDRSMDAWLTGDGKEVDPEIDHDHALSDGVFIPGLMPFGAPWASVPTDHMALGADSDTGPQLHCYVDKLVLGNPQNATKTLKAEALVADLKDAVSALNTILQAGTSGSPVKQQIVQAAQWQLTQLYLRLQAGGDFYLSSVVKNE